MKISKKAARELGAALAQGFHNCASVEERSGVLTARLAIVDTFQTEAQWAAFEGGFRAKLDELEPRVHTNRLRILPDDLNGGARFVRGAK
jgi:hypothetical protein